MSYIIDNVHIELKFNSNDIVIQIEDVDEKLYQDVFILDDIKKQNGYFDSIKKVESFVDNCFELKENFDFNFTKKKTFIVKLEYINEMGIELFLKFELLPIRKDISNNKEIISMKRKIKKLESKIKKYSFLDNYYTNYNLCEMVPYKGFKNISFSDLDERNPLFLGTYTQIKDQPYITNFIDNYNSAGIASASSPMIYTSIYHHNIIHYPNNGTAIKFKSLIDSIMNYKIVNYKVKNIKDNFITEDFQNIECDNLYLYHLHNLSFEFIPKVDKLIILECKFQTFDELKNIPNKLVLFNCNFENLDYFKNIKENINIEIYGTKPSINESLFGSNIKLTKY